MHTDFPLPVAPAIKRCGIDLRSATIAFPEISLPSENVILLSAFLNSGDEIISRSPTMFISSFSISMPTAAFPGIGASILMLFALKLSAISSPSLTMLLTLTPALGSTSYFITAGPCVTFVTFADTLKLFRVSSRSIAFSFNSLVPIPLDFFKGLLSSDIGGNLYLFIATPPAPGIAGILVISELPSGSGAS